MGPEEERTTAAGLQQGDTEAWRSLYDAYSARVWNLVAMRVGSDANAIGDIVQETFLAAARSARQFNPQKGSLWAWLRGIAHHQLAFHFRQEQRHRRVPSRDGQIFRTGAAVLDWLTSDEPGPLESLEAVERAQLIREAFGSVSEEYALLLAARYFEGYSVQKIAEQHASTPSAIRSKLKRARHVFRQVLHQIGGPEPFHPKGLGKSSQP